MKVRNAVSFLWIAALVAGSTGGCKCGKSKGGDSAGTLDSPSLVDANPTTPALTIDFPERWRSRDAVLNAFIESALKTAAEGDYDGFRQLFGTAYTPPPRQEFQHVWEAVSSITVAGLYGDRPVPEKFFLHAVVDRRQPDRKKRLRLNVVVMVFQEAGRWRLGPAPKEVVDLIVKPASQPSGETEPDKPASGG
jgi:hypothetical protein